MSNNKIYLFKTPSGSLVFATTNSDGDLLWKQMNGSSYGEPCENLIPFCVPADGTDGTDGTDGVDGNTILSGSGAPASGLGTNGDFYIDTENNNIYGAKSVSGWGSPTSLVGQGVSEWDDILSKPTITASGGNVTGTLDLGAGTLTLTAPTGGNALTQEEVQDYVSSLFTHSNHGAVTADYDDVANQIILTVNMTDYTLGIDGGDIVLYKDAVEVDRETIPISVTWADISSKPTLTQDGGNVSGSIALSSGDFTLSAPVSSTSQLANGDIVHTPGDGSSAETSKIRSTNSDNLIRTDATDKGNILEVSDLVDYLNNDSGFTNRTMSASTSTQTETISQLTATGESGKPYLITISFSVKGTNTNDGNMTVNIKVGGVVEKTLTMPVLNTNSDAVVTTTTLIVANGSVVTDFVLSPVTPGNNASAIIRNYIVSKSRMFK